MNKKKIYYWLLLPVLALMIGACGKSDDEEVFTPDVNVGETVTDFKKAVRYEDTKYFDDDLDALVTYALTLRYFRWTYFKMATNSDTDEPFCADLETIGDNKNTKYQTMILYNLIDRVTEMEMEYMESIERLTNSGVLVTPNTTRGILSDGWDFITGCKSAQKMGRKSVVAVARKLGWTNDYKKMDELYKSLPEDLRRGYTNSADFWRDFSSGTIDARANQVFVNLYYYADPDFGETARDMGTTPGKNVTVAAADLIEKGANLVIDACPISSQISYGKDLYGAVTATEDLVIKGDVKGFMKNAANNIINYGRDVTKLADKLRGLDINYWDYGDKFWDYAGKDMYTIWMNDVCFNEQAGNKDTGEGLIPNMVKTHDANGKEIYLVVMVDAQSGKTTIGYVLDKDGNIITNPQLPGQKTITAVNRKTGKRVTKTIIVPKDQETDVEVDLDDDENQLEENPKDGYLSLDRKSMEFFANGGRLKTMVSSNYLYYSCSTKDNWITCSIPSDLNEMTVRVATNDSTAERKGQVTVMATDSKGKVLKTVVLAVVQKGKEVTENYINASPSTLLFDAKGGKLSSTVSHSRAYNYVSADYDNSMAGWATVDVSLSGDDFVITVDATPNTTGKERTGMVTAFAAYNQQFLNDALNGNVDANNVLVTTIVVKQAANEAQEDGEEIKDAVRTVQFDFDVAALNDEGKNSTDGTSWSFDKSEQPEDVIKVTKKGKGIHVECSTSYKKAYSSEGYTDCSATLSFDVDDLGDAWMNHKTKVLNGKFKSNETDYYNGEKTSVGEYAIDFTNVPMKSSYWWQGETANGVQFSNFYSKRSYNLNHPETAGSSSFTFVDSPTNVINVICVIKPDIIYIWK